MEILQVDKINWVWNNDGLQGRCFIQISNEKLHKQLSQIWRDYKTVFYW